MRITLILFVLTTGAISCSLTKNLNTDKDISLEKEYLVSLPSFSNHIYDWLISDSLIIVSAANGIFYTSILKPERWNKISSHSFKSIDISNFRFDDGRNEILLLALPHNNSIISAYILDLKNDSLVSISAGEIPSGMDQCDNLLAYKSDKNASLFVSGQRGLVEQWVLYDPGWGQVDGKVVKQFSSPFFYNKYLAIADGIIAGAYPDKGWWSLTLNEAVSYTHLRAHET
jgi:hypothetical protein